MKVTIALSILALGLAQAKHEEAEQLENNFKRALGSDERDLWGGGMWGGCCTWVCEEPEPEPEPEPCYYRSKAMMMGGSYWGGDDCAEPYYYGSRRVKETKEEVDRKLWYGGGMDGCEWDCSGCGVMPPVVGPPIVGPPTWPGHGYQCFPTSASPDDCSCTCCGFIPPPVVIEPEPEPEPEPCIYRSKAMMMGGGWYGGDDCGPIYRSKAMMGGSRRVKETVNKQQGERALPGKGWGGGWGGPAITCDCECEVPEPPPRPIYRSKAMMMGGSYYY